MSKLAEFRAAERALAEQLAYLESLKLDAGLKKEIEFESELKNLLTQYGKNLRDVIAILDPGAVAPRSKRIYGQAKPTRRARALKVYKNPHTGETVETKGGNHKVLKLWKEQHGSDTVESWLQQ